MNEKPEALRLAELLNEATTVLDEPFHHNAIAEDCDKAADELRRLHAENEALTAIRDRQAAMLRRLEEREAELDAEIGRLRDELRQSSVDYTRAEIERLREQIKDCDATIEALQGAVARAAKKVLIEK